MLGDLHPRSSRGVSGDILKAERGVASCGGRLVTVRSGRSGKSPARHYDLAARSSLHGSGKHLPAVVGRRAPKETEARPREPKIATVERREASVPRHNCVHARLDALWDARRLASAWPAASCAGLTGASQAPERLSTLRLPLDSGWRSKVSKPRAQKTRRGNEMGCLTS